MFRLLTALFVTTLALAVVAPAAPIPRHLMPKEPVCYPTRVGDRMTYRLDGKEVVSEVTAVEKAAGGTAVTLGWVAADGTVSDAEAVVASPHGLKVVRPSWTSRRRPPPRNFGRPSRSSRSCSTNSASAGRRG